MTAKHEHHEAEGRGRRIRHLVRCMRPNALWMCSIGRLVLGVTLGYAVHWLSLSNSFCVSTFKSSSEGRRIRNEKEMSRSAIQRLLDEAACDQAAESVRQAIAWAAGGRHADPGRPLLGMVLSGFQPGGLAWRRRVPRRTAQRMRASPSDDHLETPVLENKVSHILPFATTLLQQARHSRLTIRSD